MAASDYEFVTGLACAYMARKTKSKKLMSQDRRVVTDNEILGLFEFYLRHRVEVSGRNEVVVARDGKTIFKAELLDVEEEEEEERRVKWLKSK